MLASPTDMYIHILHIQTPINLLFGEPDSLAGIIHFMNVASNCQYSEYLRWVGALAQMHAQMSTWTDVKHMSAQHKYSSNEYLSSEYPWLLGDFALVEI